MGLEKKLEQKFIDKYNTLKTDHGLNSHLAFNPQSRDYRKFLNATKLLLADNTVFEDVGLKGI